MTTYETIDYIRMLIDDGVDWFPTLPELLNIINEAQYRVIHKALTVKDEKALRPLYRDSVDLTSADISLNDSVVLPVDTTAGTGVLSSRSCRINNQSAPSTSVEVVATYLPYGEYLNYTNPAFRKGLTYPRTVYYTLIKKNDLFGAGATTFRTIIYFSNIVGYTATAVLRYVTHPLAFNHSYTISADRIELSLPIEYHPTVCAIAAEIINNADVGEYERGEIALPQMGQRLTLAQSGGGR